MDNDITLIFSADMLSNKEIRSSYEALQEKIAMYEIDIKRKSYTLGVKDTSGKMPVYYLNVVKRIAARVGIQQFHVLSAGVLLLTQLPENIQNILVENAAKQLNLLGYSKPENLDIEKLELLISELEQIAQPLRKAVEMPSGMEGGTQQPLI